MMWTPGYIGGSVLAKLLEHSSRDTFDITVIVRAGDKAKQYEQFGVKAVVGSFKEDHALLAKLVEQAHVVFSCVSSTFDYTCSVNDLFDRTGGCG